MRERRAVGKGGPLPRRGSGRRTGVPLVRLSPYSKGMKTKPLAFSVHLFTASGAGLALMAIVAAGDADWRLMFGWLGVALIVDGIDGPLARHVDTKRNAANWDGVILDLVIDYLTYVFIPAYALIYSGIVPAPWGSISALFIALTGAMYFADVRMKAEDNCFVGFPAVWQMPLLVFLTFDPPPWVTLGTILLLGLGQFTRLKFIHPVRTARWRSVNLPICILWVVLAGWSVVQAFQPPHLVRVLLGLTSVWLVVAGIAMQAFPAKKAPRP